MQGIRLSYLKKGLISQSGFLILATGTGYAFSYLYLLAMGRLLGPETYGILGALFAIFYSTCLIGQAMMEAIATNIAAVKVKFGEAAAASVFRRLSIRLVLVFLLPALVLIIFARPVASFFHLSYTGPVIMLAIAIFTALLINTVLGLLQGLQKFRQLGITGYLVAQGVKLLAGVIFVWVGWDLMGAMGALVAATAAGTVVGLVLVRKHLAAGTRHGGDLSVNWDHIFLPTLSLAIFLSMPASVDVMLVTHFFGGEEAGVYNAVATLGKVIVFLPMAVSLILLPKATEGHALGLDTKKILLQSFIFTSILSGVVALIYWLFPDVIITFFFGEAYHEGGALVRLYSVAMLLFSLNVVLIHYSLAIRNLWLMLLADLITLVEVVAIVLMHQSLSQVIWILVWGNLLILLVSLPFLVFSKARHDGNGTEG
ncbi:MAG: oligosaccharide flippase family protein [Dehalococcoidia bacterium]|nr:oligosaccharide flippase family protein [Dehalococcoidia bacterium]